MAEKILQGTIKEIFPSEQKTEKFTLRKFALTIPDGNYHQQVLLELTNQKVTLVDNFSVGDEVKVSVNIKGRCVPQTDGSNKYFNTVEVWKMEAA